MISAQELCEYSDELLSSQLIKDYCPNGLQCEGTRPVEKIAVAVSASLETLEAFVESGADLLLVHHGLFWNRDNHAIIGTKRKKIALLMEKGLHLVAYHLPLDYHQDFGNNYKAAKDMQWSDLTPFIEDQGQACGVQANFGEMAIDDFIAKVEDYYGHPAHVARGSKRRVSSVALVSGGAHKMLEDAVRKGVDCFITGSFDEPMWHMAKEENVHFLALGHSATERVGPQALGQHLAERFGLGYEFIDIHNPF